MMRAVKARFSDGKIVLPAELPSCGPCDVTVLFPDGKDGAPRPDRERFLRAAGSWADMDAEEIKRRIYEARHVSLRERPQL